MRLFYIDESGNTGRHVDATQPIHWLVAIGVSPIAVKTIEAEMKSLATQHFPRRARRPDFEFHGAYLFSGRNECNAIAPVDRIKIYNQLMQLLERHNCSIFIRGIDKQLLQKRAIERKYTAEHPHKLASMYLFERIDEWLERQQIEGQEPVYGLLIADEQTEVDRDIVENFAYWRDNGTQGGYRERDISYLIDTVHYVPSHDSWLIQLADCVAFLRNRYGKVLRDKGFAASLYTDSDRAIVELWKNNRHLCLVNDIVWPRT
jgi:hypothetical protein